MGCCHYHRTPAQTEETLTLLCIECEDQVKRCTGYGQPARWPAQEWIRALNVAEANVGFWT